MANPFASVTVSNYNLNPPPDDGTVVPENKLNWSKHKLKIGDPLKTAIEAVNTNALAAFLKVTGGIVSTAISYQVLAADQGKTIVATASGITITTPDATSVTAPFNFSVLNLGGGDITIEGSGSQTIDGALNVTLEDTRGIDLNTNGSNWFSKGQNWQFDEPDRPVNLFNGSWAVSVGSNALTIALQNDAGTDPSATNSVLTAFRSSPVTADGYNIREQAAALTLVVPATATLGFAANEVNMLYFGLLDVTTSGVDAVVIGVSKDAAAWNEDRLVSSTLIDTASDSGTVIYSAAAQTNVPCRLLGAILITTGATAGNWSNAPTRVTGVNFNPFRPFKNACFSWANIVGAGTSFTDGFNVSSVGDTAAGRVAITFVVASAGVRSRADHASGEMVVANRGAGAIDADGTISASATAIFNWRDAVGAEDPSNYHFSSFGI